VITAERTWWRRYDDVIGMNVRNAHIARVNPPDSVRLVNDKAATKDALSAVGVPVAPTLALVADGRWVRRLEPTSLPDAWAIKPNQGLGGNGILISAGRSANGWRRPSGRPLDLLEVKDHLRFVLDGEFSGRARDKALVEPLLVADPEFAALAHQGLPDVRVICVHDEPKVAMARLPTASSGGRANLHQGAIGAAVDLRTGRIEAARCGTRPVTEHPDTGARIVGSVIPAWSDILAAASRCGPATGLGYVGADIVIDAERGPLVLEVNARPGLQIQNVSASGLRSLLAREINLELT
jgi:alpha-L-glutamate ligase-like protein